MAPVHLYLAAWILGGVLLGASMLLDARDPQAPEDGPQGPETSLPPGRLAPLPHAALVSSPALPARSRGRDLALRSARVFPLGLIGFGLSGLLAKGLELDLWPWTFLIALSIGAALIALGYRLSHTRAFEANKSA
jgi:MFS family permease